MTARFVVVAEDQRGFDLATVLCDRVIAERASWLRDHWQDNGLRDALRIWVGLEVSSHLPWSTRGDVKRLARERSIRVHAVGLKAEGALAYKAVALVSTPSFAADALFLVHDSDGDPKTAERMRDGARRHEEVVRRLEVIPCVPHPEAEAWVVAGFVAESIDEDARHKAERQRLGFDPVAHPERLSAGKKQHKHDAKRTCEAILGEYEENAARWRRCWQETPLEALERNGERAGLRDYTQDVEERILPLLGDRRAC